MRDSSLLISIKTYCVLVVFDTKFLPSRKGVWVMNDQKPFHITPHGGSIHCLEGLAGRLFKACSANYCTYTGDLHSAKSCFDFSRKSKKDFALCKSPV